MIQDILIYLKEHHQGKANAITSKQLQSKFSIDNRIVRIMINQLRNEGNPICSDYNGYYYAADKDEINDSVFQMTSRIREISKVRDNLIKSAQNIPDDVENYRKK